MDQDPPTYLLRLKNFKSKTIFFSSSKTLKLQNKPFTKELKALKRNYVSLCTNVNGAL